MSGVERTRSLVVTVGLLTLSVSAGCGSGQREETQSAAPPENAAARTLAAWSSAAISENAVLQQCARQPEPTKGYMAACTHQWRKIFDRATRKLLQTAGSVGRSGPPACHAALSQARLLAIDVSNELTARFGLRAHFWLGDTTAPNP